MLAALMCASLCASAQQSWVKPAERGWHWYETPPAEAKRPAKKPAKAAKVAEPPLESFSTAWIRENLPRLRDKAIDEPTDENVTAYLALQRLAVERADRFAQVSQMVTNNNPLLDENNNYPVSSVGAALARDRAEEAKVSVISSLSGRVGIWFFFRSDCPYCHASLPVLQMLAAQTGIRILPISLDGPNLEGSVFTDYVIDNGQGTELNVTQTPTFYLVDTKDRRKVLLGEGYMALPIMLDRIISQAYYYKWITPEAYASTRLSPVDLNAAADLPAQTRDVILKVYRKLPPAPRTGDGTPVNPRTLTTP